MGLSPEVTGAVDGAVKAVLRWAAPELDRLNSRYDMLAGAVEKVAAPGDPTLVLESLLARVAALEDRIATMEATG